MANPFSSRDLNTEGKQAHKVTLIGAFVNLGNAIIKIVVGAVANSYALIADGIHSLSDLASDVMVLTATHYARQKPDHNHPYGHQRFETLGTLFMGGILFVISGALIWDGSLRALSISGELSPPKVWAFIAVAVSILSKEWIFQYTMRIANQIKSDLLVANAWHHRTDSLSSIVVLISLVGSYFGLVWLDPLAVVIVGGMIAKVGGVLIWGALKELVDTGLPPEKLKEIEAVAKKVPGVLGIHEVKSRMMGQSVYLDLHIDVDASLSVSEGHEIGLNVKNKIFENFLEVGMINFHIDPDNGEHDKSEEEPPDTSLPLRPQAMEQLMERWGELEALEYLDKVILHYFDTGIEVEVYFKPETHELHDIQKLKEMMKLKAQDLPWIYKLRLWYGY